MTGSIKEASHARSAQDGQSSESSRSCGPISRWFDALHASRRGPFYVSYCVLFAVMFCAMYAVFFIKGVDFIWIDDGLTQQYTVFIELGDWMRQLLHNVFISHTFVVPMWSPELGYGQDYVIWVAGTLGNPINWIAVFSTPENAQLLLNLTVPITLFLAGIAFVELAFYHGNDGFAVLVGVMAFLFSGVTIIAFNQILLIYPMVLAPLGILGVDKVIDGRSPATFMAAIALFALYSLTMLWMFCILLALYCVIRFAFMEDRSAKRFFSLLLRTVGYLLVGLAMGAVLLLPNAMAVLSLGRVGLERSWDAFYSFDYYIQIAKGAIGFSYAGSECFIGMLTLSVLAVAALFASKKDATGKMLAIMFVILVAFLLLPALGKVMNGFAYPNNRWTWMFALLVGYITTYMTPQFLNGVASEKRVGATLFAVILFFMVMGAFVDKMYYLPLMMLWVLFAFLLYARGVLLETVLICSLVISTGVLFGMWGRYAATRNVPIGQAYEMATAGANSAVEALEGDDWRFEATGTASVFRNSSSIVDKNGTTFYNSMYNGSIDDYHTQLGLTTSPLNFSTVSLDNRSIMEQMGNVRYVVARTHDAEMVSKLYGQDEQPVEAEGALIYQADVRMPFATLFSDQIRESDFRGLSPVDAQEALLQGAVLPDGECRQGDIIQPAVMNQPLEFSYQLSVEEDQIQKVKDQEEVVAVFSPVEEGASQGDGLKDLDFQTTKGATMHLDVDIPAGVEAYVVLEDVDFTFEPTLAPDASRLDRLSYGLRGIFPLADNGCNISVTTATSSEGVWQTGKDAHLYSGKDTWAFCLGSSDEPREGVDIAFAGSGSYRIKDLSVRVEDTQAVKSAIKNLETKAASDISLEENTFSCHVDVASESETLLVLLPFSPGWSSKIDGQDVETLPADVGFIGLQVPAGAHDIQITYETPGLKAGAVISLIGIAGFIGIILYRRKRNTGLRKGR